MDFVLNKSDIIFDNDNHTYTTQDGHSLSGVTSLLSRQLFKDKYANVPDFVLAKAAERGSNIHEEVSLFIKEGKMPLSAEGHQYITLDIDALESEYLVSDNSSYASSIDIVGKDLTLYDIKTNRAGIDKEYVRWQLSIYAYLFEMQNPELKVKALKGIWLSEDRAEVVEVERIDDNIIQELLEVDSMGLDFINPFAVTITLDEDNLSVLYETEEKLSQLLEMSKQLEEVKKKTLESIKVSLEEQGLTSFENDRIKITLVGDSEKTTFDSKKFKESHPELYSEFTKVSKTKGYVKVTMR